jgi:acetyl-CoA synthetase
MSYYKIENLEEYFKHYKKSIREPKKFWDRIASENFTWYQEWDNVIDFNMAEAEIKWFTNAKVNITKNCSLEQIHK